MSPVGDKEGSLTRHFMLADIPGAVAGLPQPATLADAQAALDSVGTQHGALAVRLFVFEGIQAEQTPTSTSVVFEDEMVTACRNHDPAAPLLVWCALIMGDHRVGDAVETFLTGPDGKLDPSHFDGTQLEQYLSARGIGSADKAASNILRWFETAGLVVPRRHGPTIIGFDQQLPTSHAAAALARLVADRMSAHRVRPAPGADPVALALGVGANRWLNLTPGEFETAARPSALAPAPAPRPPVPPHLAELHRELYRKGQVILQGPPGTGKTYLARKFVSWFTAGSDSPAHLASLLDGLPDHERTPRRVAEIVAASGLAGIWDIVQFHPSLTYDDFVRSLRAEPVAGGVTFVPTNRLFGFVCEVGRHLVNLGAGTEVLLLVDEINRADISKVLGELIYGLEYRGEPVTTPYVVGGSASLVVPANLFVVGTMNTADRSIALIDYALRRRFVYLDVTPDRSVIANFPGFAGHISQDGALALFDATARLFEGSAELRTIQVGHSYFLSDGAGGTVHEDAEVIARRFSYEVVPLLFEYEAEGRFQSLGLDALFEELALVTRPLDGAVDQQQLITEVRDRIAAGTLGTSTVAQSAAPAAGATAGSPAPDQVETADDETP